MKYIKNLLGVIFCLLGKCLHKGRSVQILAPSLNLHLGLNQVLIYSLILWKDVSDFIICEKRFHVFDPNDFTFLFPYGTKYSRMVQVKFVEDSL